VTNVVLLGPPGAGKGTQAVRVASVFGLVHLSSGDILRAERQAKTDLGSKAQDYMDRGALVPDDLILSMMEKRIASLGAGGFLLDGFPRTLAQAQGLDERLAKSGHKIDVVVNMVVEDAEVTRRLTGRWSCPKDGRVYHEVFSPPAKAGVCDACGTALTRRKDDEPQVVGQRLKTYHDQTKPLVAYYEGKGVLKSVQATGPVETVGAAIEKACRAS
jgi:adenylate kinase